MKKIWIVNYHTSPPEVTGNPRHREFAKRLQKLGYHVRIICSGYLNNNKENMVPTRALFVEKYYDGIPNTFIKALSYDKSSIMRGVSIFSFAINLNRCYKEFEKPDIIIHNIHAPFDYPISWLAKKTGAKYFVEAWDLWPEAFVRFHVLPANHPIVKISYYYEKKLYEKADEIIFSIEGGVDYLRSRGYLLEQGGKIDPHRVHYINNGINIRDFENNIKFHPTKDADLLNPNIIKVVYVGSIKLVNDVQQLIDAAELLRNYKNIVFVIIGDGKDRPFLEQHCKDLKLENVHFKQKRVPFEEVADIVCHADVNVMNYQKGFGKWGVSSGKMFLYYAAAKPICSNVDSPYIEINKQRIGIAKCFGSAQEYADAILSLVKLTSEEKKIIAEKCKLIASQYDFDFLTDKLIEVIENN